MILSRAVKSKKLFKLIDLINLFCVAVLETENCLSKYNKRVRNYF